MSGYLRRLAGTGAAYTAASVISKLIAVALVIAIAGPLTLSMFVDYVREVLISLPNAAR